MAIAANTIYADVAREVGTGTGTTDLAAAFVRCANRALDQLSISADLASRFDHIDATDDTFDANLDDEFEYVLKAGIILHLMRSGYRSRDPKLAALVFADAREAWENGVADFIMAQDNEEQAVDGAEIVGLLRDDDNA